MRGVAVVGNGRLEVVKNRWWWEWKRRRSEWNLKEIEQRRSYRLVRENTSRGERAYDLFSRHLKERIVCIHGPCFDDTSSLEVAQMLYQKSGNSENPVNLYSNSPGGVVTAGLAMFDTMQYIRSPLSSLTGEQEAPMASLLLAVGAPGERRVLPNARVMINLASREASCQANSIAIQARQILDMRLRLSRLYVRHTGKDTATIESSMERDHFMSPDEAKQRGLVDEVIDKRLANFNANCGHGFRFLKLEECLHL